MVAFFKIFPSLYHCNLSFYLFSSSGPPCLLQPFLLFCYLRVQMSSLLSFLSLCALLNSRSLFTSLSMWSVCACGKDPFCIGSAVGKGFIISKKMQNISTRVYFSKYFNGEYQQMQKLKSNIHKL